MTPLPWEPRPFVHRMSLAVGVLIGGEVTEAAHAAHFCGSPRLELCEAEPGAPPHILDHVAPVVVPPVVGPPERIPMTMRVPRTVDARATVYAPVTIRVPVGGVSGAASAKPRRVPRFRLDPR